MDRLSRVALVSLSFAALGFRCPGPEPYGRRSVEEGSGGAGGAASVGVGGATTSAGGSVSVATSTTSTGNGGAPPVIDSCVSACEVACDDAEVDACTSQCLQQEATCQGSVGLPAFWACYASSGCVLADASSCGPQHCPVDPAVASLCLGICDDMINNNCFSPVPPPPQVCIDNCVFQAGNCTETELTILAQCVAPYASNQVCVENFIDDCVVGELGGPGQCLAGACLPSEWDLACN